MSLPRLVKTLETLWYELMVFESLELMLRSKVQLMGLTLMGDRSAAVQMVDLSQWSQVMSMNG